MGEGNIPGLGLLEGISDRRNGSRKAIIFSPVGDAAQLEGFLAHLGKLGAKDKFDYLFIYRKGVERREGGLSAIHATEKKPLGTSGCFFAGQALSYLLGYDVVVTADLDAFLDSGKTLLEIARLASEKGKAVVPLSKIGAGDADDGYFVMNQWGAIPRQAFDAVGFELPYTYKGGEDFEYAMRLGKQGRLLVYHEGYCVHPRAGLSIFSKIANRRKFYPYVAGLLKAYAFCGGYDIASAARYVATRLYYSFFADVAGDSELQAILKNPQDIGLLEGIGAIAPIFSVRKIGEGGRSARGAAKAATEIACIASLALSGSARCAGEGISASLRGRLALGAAAATVLLPLRIAEAALGYLRIRRWASGLAFPGSPQAIDGVARDYLSMI